MSARDPDGNRKVAVCNRTAPDLMTATPKQIAQVPVELRRHSRSGRDGLPKRCDLDEDGVPLRAGMVVWRKIKRNSGYFFEQFIERRRVRRRGNLVAVAAPDARFSIPDCRHRENHRLRHCVLVHLIAIETDQYHLLEPIGNWLVKRPVSTRRPTRCFCAGTGKTCSRADEDELPHRDTFTASFNRLCGLDQKAVKVSVFDLQMDPAGNGLQLHRIDKSKDPNFWSARVNRDVRLIIHKTGESLLVAYVGRHDDAYVWAERRRIEAHPRTGAVQIVEARERVEEVAPPSRFDFVFPEPAKSKKETASASELFASLDDDALLSSACPPIG